MYRVITEVSYYDAEKVKDFLMEQKQFDPQPLMILCSKHNMHEELTAHL